MQFESLMSFFQMDGHGLYVWLSYVITLVVLALNFVMPRRAQKKILISLQKRILRENSDK
jgi:heme exporter protein D